MRRRTVGLLLALVGVAMGAAVLGAASAVAQSTPAQAAPAQATALAQAQPAAGAPVASQPATPNPGAPTGAWPKTLPDAKAEAEARANPQPAPPAWTAGEIELAKARCTAILKGLEVVTLAEPPVRDGECGAPAPVRLVSIGRNPEVSLSPPPIVTCDMVVALHAWMKSDVQPLAKKHLGAPVIKIETMSDYSCRTAYGRAKNRLSEHGKANALDIRGFTTAKGETALLLADWGLTARDIAAQVAAAKAEAEKLAREKAAAEAAALAARSQKGGPGHAKPAGGPATAAAPASPGSAIGLRDGGVTLTEGLPRVMLTIPGVAQDDATAGRGRTGSGFSTQENRLGGPRPVANAGLVPVAQPVTMPTTTPKPKPKPADKQANAPIVHAPGSSRDQTSAKAKFLREAHAAGCRIFGTTLGPEANNAHRNHFHVDMAERKTTNFCE